jgi:hypothetical protein
MLGKWKMMIRMIHWLLEQEAEQLWKCPDCSDASLSSNFSKKRDLSPYFW